MFLHVMQKRCPCLSDPDQHLFRFTESTEQNSQQGQSTDFQAIEPLLRSRVQKKRSSRTWYAS
jgi:hypothetical protein